METSFVEFKCSFCGGDCKQTFSGQESFTLEHSDPHCETFKEIGSTVDVDGLVEFTPVNFIRANRARHSLEPSR